MAAKYGRNRVGTIRQGAILKTDLTKRQRQVLNAITPGISLRELMAKLGISCPNGIVAHLKPLKRKGYIDWQPGKSRTLVRLDKGIPLQGTVR